MRTTWTTSPNMNARSSYPRSSYPGGSALQSGQALANPPHILIRRRRSPQPARLVGTAMLKLAVVGGLLAALVLPILLPLSAYIGFQAFSVVASGVKVGEVSLGGLTAGQAMVELDRVWNQESRMVLSGGGKSWTVPSAEVGLRVDPAATVSAALNVGRGGGLRANLAKLRSARQAGWEVEPVVALDAEKARLALAQVAQLVSVAPQDASFAIQDGRVAVVPAQFGQALDLEATLAPLAAHPDAVLQAGALPLVLIPVAPAVTDVSAAAAEAERLLSAPFAITLFDPISGEWTHYALPAGTAAAWLRLLPAENSSQGQQVWVDEQAVQLSLEALNQQVGPERWFDPAGYARPVAEAFKDRTAVTVELRHHSTRYTVAAGDTLIKIGWKVGVPYWMIVRANPDLDLNVLRPGQEITIPSKDELLPLPVVQNKRIVVSIGQQRLWAYQNGDLFMESSISTGIDRSPTQPGVFQVQTHEVSAYAELWDLTMPHFIGIYEAWPGFMNGFHGLPTLSNGQILWANVLGRPASYGCIILNLDDAERLFYWADPGVVVEIKE